MSIVLLCSFFCRIPLSAHHSWIIPAQKDRVVEIGHGHTFPISEQAMNSERIHVTLLSHNNQTTSAQVSKESNRLTAFIPLNFKELTAALFHEDPIIMNRTPQGIKMGPMSEHKGVIDSFRRYRSGVFQASPEVNIPPISSHLVLSCRRNETGLYLQCHIEKQLRGEVDVEVLEPGSNKERKLGKTDSTGCIPFILAKPGIHLFSAHCSQASQDSDTKRDDYSATLVVGIK